jgi:hypothetical protein
MTLFQCATSLGGNVRRADDVLLAKLGYKSEFRREFSVSLITSTEGYWVLRQYSS